MTRSTPARTSRLLASVLLLAALCACGGNDDDSGSGSLRVVNATADAAALDITVEGLDDDNDDSGEVRLASGVLRDGQSEYVSLEKGSWRVRMKRANASSTLALNSAAVAKNERYTLFAYGREGDYRLITAFDDEDEDAPASGKAKVRVLNAAPDAGSVDVYVTETGALLQDTVPTHSSVAGGTLGFYTTIDRGTFRLRVTAAGDKDDVRLDVEGLVLPNRELVTIVLQPGPGGLLVNALVSQFQGSLSALKNLYARVRLVASATANAAVTATLGTTSLNVNLRSPSVGRYTLVPAGSLTASIRVNGTIGISEPVSVEAGGDYTLAVYGDALAPSWRLIADDNRLPSGSERAKMRLLHLADGVGGTLTLVKDYVGVANDVAYSNASSYTQVTAATAARIEVTSPLSVTPLFLAEDVSLPTGSVFTAFMLSGGAAPTGILRRER